MMTTATVTWPTSAELLRVERLVVEACAALDELAVSCHRLADDVDALEDAAPLPTLTQLGALSRFLVCVEQDVETMSAHVAAIRETHRAGALRVGSDAGADATTTTTYPSPRLEELRRMLRQLEEHVARRNAGSSLESPAVRLIQGGRSAGCSPREGDDAR
jgi:hypothetical protein